MPESAVYVLEKMSHGLGRHGKETGGGFYDTATGQLWSGLEIFERAGHGLTDDEIADRLRYAQAAADEGARARWIEAIGTQAFTTRAAELEKRFGPRFALRDR